MSKTEKIPVMQRFSLSRMSDTERWVCGFALLFVALLLLVSIVSYYFTWSADQVLLREGVRWGDVENVRNGAGKFGVVIGNLFVGKWFGLFALCVPVVLMIFSVRIIRGKHTFMSKYIRIVCVGMILGSVSLGYIFGTKWSVFGSGLGGEAGIAVAVWLKSSLGAIGLGLLLLMAWVLLAVYINRRTIKIVNNVGGSVGKGVTKGTSKLFGRKKNDNGKSQAVPQTADEDLFEIRSVDSKDGDDADINAGAGNDRYDGMPDDDIVRNIEDVVGAYKTDSNPAEGVQGDFGVVAGAGDDVARQNDCPFFDDDDEDFVVVDSNGDRVKTPHGGASVTLGAGGVVESSEEGIRVLQAENEEEEIDAKDMEDLYDPTRELKDYQRPPVEILEDHSVGVRISEEEIRANKDIIREKLSDFGIKVNDKIKATIGPTVTLYEIEPAQGVKISRIRNLEEDIALALKVQGIRIVTLGAGHGTVGIEVPNSTREVVSMYSVVKSIKFQDNQYKLPIALGKTIYNEIYIGDLTKMPHLLVAGATGQGKSVGLNAIITSLLYKKHPAELKFVLVDPKQVELSVYAKLEKHFLAKMESEEKAILTDTQKVVYTLNSLVNLMETRYGLLNKAGERNISDYNEKFLKRRLNPNKGHHFMPYIVVIIDEFADMIMTAGKEVEVPITRLAAKARAVGIHLIVATQRPDVKVITGLIKSNIPARIAFKVVSMVDSRTIIDQPGANNLIGMGDMLMSINGELTRIQCAFIDTPEIERMTNFIGRQRGYQAPFELPDYIPEDASAPASRDDMGKTDDMFEEVARFVVQNQQGSTSSIQRHFSIGYNRAGRLMDQLERAGVVGRPDGSKPREVLVYDMSTLERILVDLL